jgi:hypothetical protein
MADTTSMQQFERGVKTIDQALRAALAQRGVSFWHIARTVVGVNIRKRVAEAPGMNSPT